MSPALAAEQVGPTFANSDRRRIFSSLQLDNAVLLSFMRRPVILPQQPAQPDSLSSSTNLSFASPSIMPLFSAPSELYDLLKSNSLVQIIADVEIADSDLHDAKSDGVKEKFGKVSDSAGLIRNLIVTLQKDSPELVRLAKSSAKQRPGRHHVVEAKPMEWQAEGSHWYATTLDARHLLVSNKQANIDKVKRRFAQWKSERPVAIAAMPAPVFNDLPSRMKLLLTDAAGDPDLWQVLDTSIVNESNADKASGQLCEFAKDKTSIVSFVEPGTDTLKAVVYSINKAAPGKLSQELSDFKEPADFVLKKMADSKFTITISGVEPKSTKAKVFLLLLTGPMSAS